MSKSLLVTYTHTLGYIGSQVEATELDSPEPFSLERLRLDIAQRMGEWDASAVINVQIMAEGIDHMKLCQEKRSNPFSWTVEHYRYEEERSNPFSWTGEYFEPEGRYCVSLWSGDYIVSRLFGTRQQCSAISVHWWERIFECRDVFAQYRRNVVEAMRQDEEVRKPNEQEA